MLFTTNNSKNQEKNELFGPVLRNLRKGHKPYLSLRKIAPDTGLTYAQLSNLEKGKCPVGSAIVGIYLKKLHLAWPDFWAAFSKEYPDLSRVQE